jgi:hypothetical protein
MKAAKFVNGHDARDGKFDKVKPAKFRGGNGDRMAKVRGNAAKVRGGGGKAQGGGKGGGKAQGARAVAKGRSSRSKPI